MPDGSTFTPAKRLTFGPDPREAFAAWAEKFNAEIEAATGGKLGRVGPQDNDEVHAWLAERPRRGLLEG